MKKIYWCLISLIMISAVLNIMFSIMQLKLPLIITSMVMILLLIAEIVFYFCFVRHKCQKCGTVFKGKKWEIFLAPHTPTKRKMSCPVCGEKMWCEECFGSLKNKENNDVK